MNNQNTKLRASWHIWSQVNLRLLHKCWEVTAQLFKPVLVIW